MDTKKWYTNSSTIAECFGITKRRVEILARTEKFKGCKIRHGTYDFYEFAKQYVDFVKKPNEVKKKEAPDTINPIYERARKDREMADKLALENQTTRQELIQTVDVAEFISALQVLYNTSFEGFKGRLITALINATLQKSEVILPIIQREIHYSRDLIAKKILDYANTLKNA